MNIAIVGYGKMGRMIREIAQQRGHKVVCIIDRDNTEDFSSEEFRKADVAIEFSTPSTAVDNILACFAAGVPAVCGTTGWTSALPELKDICDKGKGTLMWGSNYSVGVNIFMAVNRRLASIMAAYPQYSPSLTETHHIHKLDHPSGTAITLADEIVAADPRLKGWAEPEPGKPVAPDMLPVFHIREGEVPGIHTVTWDSDVDSITITHDAKSRRGFALGAVLAAEWLPSHPGFHPVADMFGFE